MFRVVSLASRGLLAIALMLGFYCLAVAIAAGLLYIPYAEWTYLDRIDLRIALFGCVTAAGVVLWSVLPRPDHFAAPGPELEASNQPELFGILDDISKNTRQSPPKNVYLIPEVNAWVAQRGGLMGIGSRRVMGLGLPLLQVLTVDQLRAVLVHEYGHYSGGDTRLSPWIQKTRMGILRTIATFGESWIRFPFTVYAKLFFRITNAVSRQQEFTADALAAQLAGPEAMIGGLKEIHRTTAAYGDFWAGEYSPALGYQVRPPLGAGFSRFLQHHSVATSAENVLATELGTAKADPYDSHPPLPQRCAALERFKKREGPVDSRPAIALLTGLPELERELLGISVSPELRDARAVEWEQVPELVWVPNWRDEVTRQAKALGIGTVADVAALCLEPQAIARFVVFPPGYLPDLEQRCREVPRVMAVAMCVALVDAGWRIGGGLGDSIRCIHEADVLEPYALVTRIAAGELTPDEWRESCDRLRIGALPLVPYNAVRAGAATRAR